jgi:hypothetical protein
VEADTARRADFVRASEVNSRHKEEAPADTEGGRIYPFGPPSQEHASRPCGCKRSARASEKTGRSQGTFI